MADVIYNNFKELVMETNAIDFESDTIKVALVDSNYSPNQDTHDFFDDITNEISGTGYTAGGETLASVATTQDNTDNEGVMDADDVTWSGADFTARGAVIYKDTGTDATSPLICYIDFGENKTASSEDFTIQWSAEGIINIG